MSKVFLDSGDDSLSIVRLLPHSSEYLLQNRSERIKEGEDICGLLYEQRYGGNDSDGMFIGQWCELVKKVTNFRKSDVVQNVLNLTNHMVAHSLDRELEQPPTFSDLHSLRDELVPIMDGLSSLVEHKATAWGPYMAETESFSIAIGRVLTQGMQVID